MEVQVTLEPAKTDPQEWSDDDILMVKFKFGFDSNFKQ